MKARDRENYTLAIYIAYAVNNPKEFPKKPFSESNNTSNSIMNDEAMELEAQKITAMIEAANKE